MHAQSSIPRTAEGRPDFQGVWSSGFLTQMERAEGASGLVVGDEEARILARKARTALHAQQAEADPNIFDADLDSILRVGNEWRTSLLTHPPNGKLPFAANVRETMMAEARAQVQGMRDDPEQRPPSERCLANTGRAPFTNVSAQNLRQMVQTREQLMIYTEEGGDLRVIGVGAQHRPAILKSFHGDSTARWDDDVLVVETTNLRAWSNRLIVITEASKVIEQFSLISADEILYRFTIEDPTLFSARWSAEFSMKRTDGPVFEFGCHMGNYSLVNILAAGRAADRRAAQALR